METNAGKDDDGTLAAFLILVICAACVGAGVTYLVVVTIA